MLVYVTAIGIPIDKTVFCAFSDIYYKSEPTELNHAAQNNPYGGI